MLRKTKATKIADETLVIGLPEQLHGLLLGPTKMDRAKRPNAFTKPQGASGITRDILVKPT
jgi:hypothetical protein